MRITAHIAFGLSLAVLVMAGAGCSGSNTNTTGADTAVTIQDNSYSPTNLTVKKGTTVTWTNRDSVAHTVTGDNGGPSSAQLANGDTYQYTFDTVGTFPYHCLVHGTGMSGSVAVTE